MTVSDSVSPSPKGGLEPARPLSKSATARLRERLHTIRYVTVSRLDNETRRQLHDIYVSDHVISRSLTTHKVASTNPDHAETVRKVKNCHF